MNETLQKVVAAMGAELERQTHENRGQGQYAASTGDGAEWIIDGRFDLEKVARAGLKAIEDPTPAMLQAAEHHKWGSPAESYAVDVPSLFGEMIGEILK